MNTATFRDLRNLIYARSGIYFQESKKEMLAGRLRSRLRARQCSSYEDYYHLLKCAAERDAEWSEVLNVVTTNETFFYRDLPQLQAFVGTIIPAVMQTNHATTRIRIWSAACSTGDEPYTLAILLLEQSALTHWTIDILGSDISDANLAAARRGIYDRHAVRNVPPSILKKYFQETDGQYVLSETVKRLVRFTTLNLYDAAQMHRVRGMDVIFCRNCLMYFDDQAKRQIVHSLYECLRPGGYLVIGFSESLHHVSTAFRPVHLNRSVVYQKV